MKKLYVFFIIINVASLVHAMQEGQEEPRDASSLSAPLGESWGVITDSDGKLLTPEAQQSQSPRGSQGPKPENPLIDSDILPNDQTVQQSLLGKTPQKASTFSGLYEWYVNTSKNASNSFQTNKAVRYSTYAGAGAVIVGAAGLVFYFRK